MNYYLLVYDRHSGVHRAPVREFSARDRGAALAERFRLERAYDAHPNVEVMLLGAESRATLETTHSRYFMSPGELAKAIA